MDAGFDFFGTEITEDRTLVGSEKTMKTVNDTEIFGKPAAIQDIPDIYFKVLGVKHPVVRFRPDLPGRGLGDVQTG